MTQRTSVHVLLAAPSFGTIGGLEGYVFRLAEFLRRSDGFTVSVLLRPTKGFELSDPLREFIDKSDLEVIIAPRWAVMAWRELRRADVVHVQNLSADLLAYARALRRRVVVTVHGHRPARPPWRMRAGNVVAGRSVARWYNSRFTMQSWEGPAPRDSARLVPMHESEPAVAAVEHDQRRGFVFAARWIPNKGLRHLIRAYADARIDHDEWPLVLLGTGPLRDEVLTMIRRLNLPIATPGFVDESQRARYMAQARWLVAPAHTREDLGLTPLEAAVLGVPSIVTRDGGLPESAGPYSLSCSPASTSELRHLLEMAAKMDPHTYHLFAEGCRRVLEEREGMEVYLKLYRRL